MELLDYEKKHIDFVEEHAHECTLFLKRDKSFPLERAGKIALFGNGARNTVKGGTGSGDVASRFFVNFEEGLTKAGFEITTKEWLDAYDQIKAGQFDEYVNQVKKEAKKKGFLPMIYSMGYFANEPDYDLPIDKKEYAADAAVYVLSRESGEGNDRKLEEGDIFLTKTEIHDILALNEKYQSFMLVLNVGGVVDLSPLVPVRNILYISQLGVVTGNILGKILLGQANPSGKLTTTWAAPVDYSSYRRFGGLDEVKYEEGIFVGYRYFDTVGKEPLYPFGFGVSYSNFVVDLFSAKIEKSVVTVEAMVVNKSEFTGREVVQLYMSAPEKKMEKEYQSLVAFKKTPNIPPFEAEIVQLQFDLRDFASYDEVCASYVLEEGNYILRLGNSSRNTLPVGYIRIDKSTLVKKCKNVMGDPGFSEISFARDEEKRKYSSGILTATLREESSKERILRAARGEDIKLEKGGEGIRILRDIPKLILAEDAIVPEIVDYKKDIYIDDSLRGLSDEELMLITLGHHENGGLADMVGGSSVHVPGGAGETVLSVPAVKGYLTMADGPAGLRLKSEYGVDKKGVYDISVDPILEKMKPFLPKLATPFIAPQKKRKGDIYHQYTTAIPIGTAIAQSWNLDFAEALGDLVGREMRRFGVNLWLAPALNIHRNIRCGRNFEYFSEDPFVSGAMAAAMTKGVQQHKHCGVTIKHLLANNQELNRNNCNSRVSERALREIYLRGFERCIKEAHPAAIMTSYNLVNRVHTSESYGLLNDILRCEFHFDGLVMSDWIASGRTFCKQSIYPAPYASNNILAGNDLTMPGCSADEKDIKAALKSGKLKRADLLISASRIVRSIKALAEFEKK